MSKNELSRRNFLRSTAVLGAASVGAGSLLAACGGGDSSSSSSSSETSAPKAADAGCNDVTGLTEQEVQMRGQLQYVEVTADEAKRCDNCQLWTEPTGDGPCGGCQLIKGPIAPKGYCVSWAARQA